MRQTADIPGLIVPPELLDAIATRVAEMVAERLGAEADGYLNTESAAAYLDTTPDRIRDLVEAGHLPCHRDGRRLLVTRADLDAYLERGKR